jgi:hypothetical protein
VEGAKSLPRRNFWISPGTIEVTGDRKARVQVLVPLDSSRYECQVILLRKHFFLNSGL